MKRWDGLLKSLPDDLTEADRTILDAKNMTWEKLAEELEVSRTALYKWIGQDRVSLRHVVAICIALNLRADICEALVRIAGYAFRNTVEHMLLHSFLYDTAGFTISKANRLMEKEGLPRLTNGKEE